MQKGRGVKVLMMMSALVLSLWFGFHNCSWAEEKGLVENHYAMGKPPLPESTKVGRTLYTDEDIAEARRKVATYDWAKAKLRSAENSVKWLLEMSLEDIWNFIPPAKQLRALNVAYAHEICPECKVDLFTIGGAYPWIMTRELPFKVQCPNCRAVFPDNDFIPWHHGGREGEAPESERAQYQFFDDGLGWVNPEGVRYAFVAHYIMWQRWRRDIIDGTRDLGKAYALSGDIRYARRAAVLLARLATIYPELDYSQQAQHSIAGFPPTRHRGRIQVLSWAIGGEFTIFSRTYDQIWPALDDAELIKFLQGKGIKNVGDLRDLIELQLISVAIGDSLASGENRPTRGIFQLALVNQAIVLNNKEPARGVTTQEIVDHVMKTGPGPMNYFLFNVFYPEGMGACPAPAYMQWFQIANFRAADLLPRLGVNLWEDLLKAPRLKKIAESLIDLTIADYFLPNIGNSGSILGLDRIWRRCVLDIAFRRFRSPRFAQALHLTGGAPKSLWRKPIDKDIAEVIEQYGIDLRLKTRSLGGFGLAVLESGRGEHKRGLAMFYGSGQAHGHNDRLNIELFAFGRSMLPDMGYPSDWGLRFRFWVNHTLSHYAVLINESDQQTSHAGDLNLFAGTPSVQLADASAEIAYPDLASLYRRQTVLIDHSPEQFYVFDLFRVRGGNQHDWSFHGPPFTEFTTEGLELTYQERGTLAGEDIAFGEGRTPSGFQWLQNVRRGYPADNWSATWSNPQEDLHLTMIMPKGFAHEVIVADGEVEPTQHRLVDTPTLRYILGRNKSDNEDEELFSNYLAIIEPHRGEAGIEKVTRLLPEGKEEGTVSVLVTHTDGQEDIIFSSLHNDLTKVNLANSSKFEVAAQFAMFSLFPDGGLRRVFLMDGTNLTTSEFSVKPGPSHHGQVIALDFQANTVTVDTLLPTSGALDGKVIHFGNKLHRSSYTIKKVRRDGHNSIIELGDIVPLVGKGKITKIDTSFQKVFTNTRIDTHNTVFAAQHQGRWLLNEDKSAGFLINSFTIGRPGYFCIKGATGDLNKIYSDRDSDGRSNFWIADIGPGDTFHIPSVTYLYYHPDKDKYRLQITTDVIMRLPIGSDTIWYRGVDGKWQSLKGKRVANGLVIAFRADDLKDGETIILTAKPDWMVLDDNYPPQVQSVRIDNRPFTPKNHINLGTIDKAPKHIKVAFVDKDNPLAMDTLKVLINGREVEKSQIQYKQKDPRSLGISLDIGDMPEGNNRIEISIADRSPAKNSREFTLVFKLAEAGNLALAAKASVSSSLAGYSCKFLNDGCSSVTAFFLRDTVNESWASAETPEPHWIEIEFPQEQTVARVQIYWALWEAVGGYYTSQQYEIQYWDGKNWKQVVQVDGQPQTRASIHRFSPIKTRKVRIWQKPGGGFRLRRNLMWVGEVQVFSQ